MAFVPIENSLQDGRPIALYEFTFGSTVWRYTSAETAIVASGQQWAPAAISDDGVRQTGEVNNDAFNITAPQWIGPSQLFQSSAPSRDVRVRVFEKHDQSAEVRIRYSGVVTQVNYQSPVTCSITCETLAATMRREGLRLSWQRSCPYALYDPVTCKVSKAAWEIPFFILAVSGSIVQVEVSGPLAVAARTNGYLDNGFIEWQHPIRGIEMVAIDSHNYSGSGDVHNLTLLDDPAEMFAGSTGKAYRGCSFTPASCQSFSNYANYGGIPDMPSKSPFDGNPTF